MNWLTNWNEAAKYPRRTRLFLFTGFVALGFVVEALAGVIQRGWSEDVGLALGFGAAMSVLVEPFVHKRLAGAAARRDPRAVVQRQVVVAIIFTIAIATGLSTGSAFAAGVIAGAGIASLSLAGT